MIGSRSITAAAHKERIREELQGLSERFLIVLIISGGAMGVDTIAVELAMEQRIDRVIIPADWKRYGRAAGPMRNQKIADDADACLAVVDKPLEKSKGTYDCVKKFLKAGKMVYTVVLE